MGNETLAARTRCRICDSTDLTDFLDLGAMPPANGLLASPDAPECRYPLQACYCEGCGLVQLRHVVPPSVLYDDYPFRTGSSARMVDHFARLFDDHPASSVIEIGGNDSSGWRASKVRDGRYLNIDPAPLADGLRQPFTEDLAKSLDMKADLIVACNVLGHVDDVHDFLRGVTHLLAEDGRLIIEVPDIARTIAEVQYGQFYHEHLSYFGYRQLAILAKMHGLAIEHTQHFPVHGGSMRLTIRRGRQAVTAFRMAWNPVDLRSFQRRVDDKREALRNRLDPFRLVIGYGASAKGAVILNYCDIRRNPRLVVDSTPSKLQKHMPGTHQAIITPIPEVFEASDAILILSANHAEEIKSKHPDYRGEWIVA